MEADKFAREGTFVGAGADVSLPVCGKRRLSANSVTARVRLVQQSVLSPPEWETSQQPAGPRESCG